MPFIGKQPAVGSFTLLDSITTSATATYALTKNGDAFYPETSRNLLVSLNGVTQAPEDAYTVSGSTIVFASALTSSDVIDYILVLGDVLDIGQPSDGTVGVSQMNSSLYTENEFFALPTGTTAQRPASPANGYTRFNTTLDQVEYYSATAGDWRVTSQQVVVASGGTETTITDGGIDYKVHTFTSSGTFTVTTGGNVEYLIVAGGGGGASNGGAAGVGGGGAGGYLSGNTSVSAQTYSITVGAGGASNGNNGSNSSFNSLTSIGGGGGGAGSGSGSAGGSGGGSGRNFTSSGGAGTSGQGNDGGAGGLLLGGNTGSGGGGGGAGSVGSAGGSTTTSGGDGGTGSSSSITGSAVSRAGGGGGGASGSSGGGTGVAGGGNGGTSAANATAGSANTGGGGGGSGSSADGGAGGSGIVIIRYAI